jgi:hypothetical protein
MNMTINEPTNDGVPEATLIPNDFLIELHEGLTGALHLGARTEQASRKSRDAVLAFVDAVHWNQDPDFILHVIEELRDSVGDYPTVTAFINRESGAA